MRAKQREKEKRKVQVLAQDLLELLQQVPFVTRFWKNVPNRTIEVSR